MNQDKPNCVPGTLNSEFHPYLKATFHQGYRNFLGYHGHTVWELFLVTKGSYKHNFNGQKEIMHRGMAYLIRPIDHHSIVQNEPDSVCLFVTISVPRMKEACLNLSKTLYDDFVGKEKLVLSLTDYQIREITDLCFYIQERLNGDPEKLELPTSLLIVGTINATINQNYFFGENKPAWLMELLKKIQSPENKSWRVSDVMDNANYSHSHIARSFQKYMGCSIIDYISEVKMQNAGSLLVYSDMSIGEISNALGYKSPTNFSAVFKEAYGLSPAQYRKKKKESKDESSEPNNLQ